MSEAAELFFNSLSGGLCAKKKSQGEPNVYVPSFNLASKRWGAEVTQRAASCWGRYKHKKAWRGAPKRGIEHAVAVSLVGFYGTAGGFLQANAQQSQSTC
jgi:hypothetical protein